MTHDQFCALAFPCDCFDGVHVEVYAQDSAVCRNCVQFCDCDFIAKVRADERERVMSEGPYFTTVVHDCCVKLQELKAQRGEAS